MQRTTRGVERTEWVNTDSVSWYQKAIDTASTWEVRDVRRTYKAGAHTETSYFGSVVRPYVGQGFWAPLWSNGQIQMNMPSWADGESPERTGAVDTYSMLPGTQQHAELFIDGTRVRVSDFQTLTYFGIAPGTHRVKFTNTTTHDGTALASSTRTHTEWEVSATWKDGDFARHTLPMLQAYYDVDIDAQGRAGAGRKKGKPVALGLEIGHLQGAVGSAAVATAQLEYRVADGTWKPIELHVASIDDTGPGEPSPDDFPKGRAFVTTWDASIPAPDAGGWIDLRVTATDEAGATFTQEIERAVEIAPVKSGH
jgi:hypothetical protein